MTDPHATAVSTPHVLVNGNVNVEKDKGTGQLLLTETSVFALRLNNGAATTGMAAGGLIGLLIGYWIDKRRARQRTPSEHLTDPEVLALPEKVQKQMSHTNPI